MHSLRPSFRAAPGCARRVCARAGQGEGFRERLARFWDGLQYERWAPRSAKAWRLNVPPRFDEQEERGAARGWLRVSLAPWCSTASPAPPVL